MKYNSPDQCCSGAFNTPQTCPQANIKTYWMFKNACPTAYAYAYDDHTSTFFCKNTGYNVYFC